MTGARRRTLGDDVQVARSHRRDRPRRRRGRVARLAAWTPPTTLSTADEANPLAQAAFDGSVLTGWLKPTGLARPSASAPPAPHHRRRPLREGLGRRRSTRDGNAVVVTVRKHKPVQRIRATSSPPTARARPARSPTTRTRRRSRRSRSRQTAPRSPPGPGTTRRAGARRSRSAGPASRASTSRRRSPRPLRRPAAGRSCASPRATAAAPSLTWQVQTGGRRRRCTSSPRARTPPSAPTRCSPGGGRWADVALAVGAGGAVQVAYLGEHRRPDREPARRLGHGRRAARRAGRSSSTGGKGTSSGTQVASAFSADGTATVAWGKPGNSLRGRRHARGLHARARAAAFGAGPDARPGGPRDRARRRPRRARPRWPG